MIWQTPTVFLAVVGVLLAGLISVGFPTVPSNASTGVTVLRYALYSVVLFFAFAISMVGTVQVRKHRMFCIARVDDMRHLETEFRRMSNSVWPIGFITREVIQRTDLYPDVDRRWIDRQSAYVGLFGLISIVTILLLVSALGFFGLAILAL